MPGNAWRYPHWLLWMVSGLALITAGCHTMSHSRKMTVGDVPRELAMASLPPYRVAAPDVLLVDALQLVPLPPHKIQPLETLLIQFPATPLTEAQQEALERGGLIVSGLFPVDPEGNVKLGPKYGAVRVSGLTVEEAKAAVVKRLHLEVKPKVIEQGGVLVELAQSRGMQQIRGEHLIRPDGTVGLGSYGAVHVAGLTLEETKATIETHLSQFLLNPEISVDVSGFNSKVYYIVFDGGGAGVQIVRLPSTGNETVLDALAQVNGLPPVSSKHHIWVARPAPLDVDSDQILPVDLAAILKSGRTATNYMVHPGDRIYVQADALITVDTYLAKVFSPIERIFGITLLGNATVRSFKSNGAAGTGGVFP